MTDEILNRLREICPTDKVDDSAITGLVRDCNIAFKIIGYEPKNLNGAVTRVYLDQDIDQLSDFVYAVWRCDNES